MTRDQINRCAAFVCPGCRDGLPLLPAEKAWAGPYHQLSNGRVLCNASAIRTAMEEGKP